MGIQATAVTAYAFAYVLLCFAFICFAQPFTELIPDVYIAIVKYFMY